MKINITEPAADKLLLHRSLEKIRLVADELKASWEPIGEYYYPYGYDSYIYFRNEQTRQFIVKEPGLGNTLKTAFNRCNATSSIQKKTLIDTLLYLVKAAPKAYRKPFLERVPEHFWSNSVDESIQKTDVFRRIILQQDTSKLKLVIEETANFLSRNPSDGLPFLLMADTLISKVDQDRRSQFLFSMMQGFSWWFDGKIEDQARITYSFVSRIKELGDTTPANRLLAFYYLYMEKNQKREASIDSIEVAYVEQTAIAESDYMIKKEKDKGRLRLALYGFGAGIITISLVALILVLLSIHKYIKQLTETIDKLIIENKAKL